MRSNRQPRAVKILVCGVCGTKAVLRKCCQSGNYGYACPVHGWVSMRTIVVRS